MICLDCGFTGLVSPRGGGESVLVLRGAIIFLFLNSPARNFFLSLELNLEDLTRQFFSLEVDFLIGGGKFFFFPFSFLTLRLPWTPGNTPLLQQVQPFSDFFSPHFGFLSAFPGSLFIFRPSFACYLIPQGLLTPHLISQSFPLWFFRAPPVPSPFF